MSDDRPHILVIDDDRRIRELLQSYLAENGFRVSVAQTVAAARERMREHLVSQKGKYPEMTATPVAQEDGHGPK